MRYQPVGNSRGRGVSAVVLTLILSALALACGSAIYAPTPTPTSRPTPTTPTPPPIIYAFLSKLELPEGKETYDVDDVKAVAYEAAMGLYQDR